MNLLILNMSNISQIMKDIKSLKIQGADNVAKAGILVLELTARKSKAKNRKRFIRELESITGKLFKTRPTEPAMRNALASILLDVQKSGAESPEALKRTAVKLCRDFSRKIEMLPEQIASFGAGLISSGDTILLHCHSESAVGILKKAKSQGKKLSAIVTETRPRNQGIITARDLLRAKIPVTFCVDSAAGYVMKKADKVLVGCDAILPDGSIVNKIGTFPAAVLADRFGKPFYVAGGTIKFTEKIEIEQRDPKEVIDRKKIPGAKIINPAFDITPAEFIDSIITEKGIAKPGMIKQIVSREAMP